MIFNEPKVEVIKIDLSQTIVTEASNNCLGVETKPGGGVGCSNAYYMTLVGGSDCGLGYRDCPIFCS